MNQVVNQYNINEKRYMEWICEEKKEGHRLDFAIIWSVMAIISVVLFFLYDKQFLFLIYAAFCIYFACLRDFVIGKGMFKRLCAMKNGNVWTRTITVTKDNIVVDDGNTVMTYSTLDVVKIDENEARIRVYLKSKGTIRFYKNSFIEGTAEECVCLLRAN